MNNSKFAIDRIVLTNEELVDRVPQLREKEQKLITLLESLKKIQQSEEWSTLKTELFEGLNARISQEIFAEARKESPDTLKLNRLSGELKWAEKYADLSKLEQIKRLELTQIRTLLYGKTQEKLGTD